MKTILLSILVVFVSCTDGQHSQNQLIDNYFIPDNALALDEAMEIVPPRTAEPPLPEYDLEKGSKVIKNGQLEFKVADLQSLSDVLDKDSDGNGNQVKNIADPTEAQDAATKDSADLIATTILDALLDEGLNGLVIDS